MHRYFKPNPIAREDSTPTTTSKRHKSDNLGKYEEHCKERCVDLKNLPADPGLRPKISSYHPNDQDEVRRAYILKGPCQPLGLDFPQRDISGVLRRFNPAWYKEHENWLEYSKEKDAIFCLCCYLFKPDVGKQSGGDAFESKGFTTWNKKDRLQIHVGGVSSAHNQALRKCEDLMKQKQHIQSVLYKQSEQAKIEYRIRLTAVIDVIRFLLHNGLAFRGNDESDDSDCKGNFLELLQFLADHNESIKQVVLENAPRNDKLTHSDIQKQIVSVAAIETLNLIIEDLDNDLFTILVDESRDVSCKEQMAIVVRFVDKMGLMVERFIGIVHVPDTTSLSLKAGIESLFSKHKLSLSRLRGQGYDGASNMQGEFNGLKALILRENKCAFFIHCFAHQLQLTLVAVAKNHIDTAEFFVLLAKVTNIVRGSCKRKDMLLEAQAIKVAEALNNGEIESGQGLNQETSLKRAGDTRWGSHYGTIMSLILMFSSVVEVLEFIKDDGTLPEQKVEARFLMDFVQSFDFAFSLHLIKNIFGITNDLSVALQKKDQDIVNAMDLVKVSKKRLQAMRDVQWESIMVEVCSFCAKHEIDIPDMNGNFVARGKSKRIVRQVTNLHHYRVELFYTVIDMQLQELNNRFSETSTELILCMACLNPCDLFSSFDKEKLLRLAGFYPYDFSPLELMALDNQLQNYIVDVRSHSDFAKLKGVGELAKAMVKTRKNRGYPLVYLLVKLALLLPVATATVERAFSSMKLIKTRLRNRMGDELLNDSLVTYIEKNMFKSVDNEAIIQRFQNMKKRRGIL